MELPANNNFLQPVHPFQIFFIGEASNSKDECINQSASLGVYKLYRSKDKILSFVTETHCNLEFRLRNFEMREENATIRHADAVVYLFDVGERNEFSKIEEEMEKVRKYVRNEVPKILIGYHEETEEREVKEEEAGMLAKRLNMKYTEVQNSNFEEPMCNIIENIG